MSEDKIEMITLYVENKGRGKALIVDSNISVQSFPSTNKEGKKSVGINAIKVEMPETNLEAFEGMVKVHYPHQLNILSAEEYEEIKVTPASDEDESKSTPPNLDDEKEKLVYESAMSGGDEEILLYMNDYPEGQYFAEVEEWGDFLDAKETNDEKTYTAFLEKYPEGKYSADVKTLLGA